MKKTRASSSRANVSHALGRYRGILIGILAANILAGCSEPTPEERLAQAQERLNRATAHGDADSGFYPYCIRGEDIEPGDCYNVRNAGGHDSHQAQVPIRFQEQVEGRRLAIRSLEGSSTFLNSIAYAPGGALVAVGGPGLQIVKADSEQDKEWDVSRYSRFADSFRDVAFRDADNGLVTGKGSIIYRTQDGGDHWHVYNETYNSADRSVNMELRLEGEAYAVDYADTSTAVVGGNSRMLRTTDDGQHFRVTGPVLERNAIQEIDFVDDALGWAVGGPGLVLKTQDGGASWSSQRIVSDDTFLLGLDFVGQHGCMGGSWQVWCSNDGGETWQAADIQLPDSSRRHPDYDITRLRLEDEKFGWFITQYGWIYQTRDGGTSWKPWVKVSQATDSTVHGLELWGMTVGKDNVWAVGRANFTSPVSQGEDGTTRYTMGSTATIISWPRANPEN
ncbi:hypothetical protein KDX00_04345 [Cobetia amphilecti]|nr:hypothetical protein KDX00_04345 [Cobetia litoralis]